MGWNDAAHDKAELLNITSWSALSFLYHSNLSTITIFNNDSMRGTELKREPVPVYVTPDLCFML